PGLDDAGLVGGDELPCRAEVFDVVDAHVRDHGDAPVDNVGGVPRPTHADLDDGHVDGDVREPRERGGGEDLEVARPVGQVVLDVRDAREQVGERHVRDRLSVPQEALAQL